MDNDLRKKNNTQNTMNRNMITAQSLNKQNLVFPKQLQNIFYTGPLANIVSLIK